MITMNWSQITIIIIQQYLWNKLKTGRGGGAGHPASTTEGVLHDARQVVVSWRVVRQGSLVHNAESGPPCPRALFERGSDFGTGSRRTPYGWLSARSTSVRSRCGVAWYCYAGVRSPHTAPAHRTLTRPAWRRVMSYHILFDRTRG